MRGTVSFESNNVIYNRAEQHQAELVPSIRERVKVEEE